MLGVMASGLMETLKAVECNGRFLRQRLSYSDDRERKNLEEKLEEGEASGSGQ